MTEHVKFLYKKPWDHQKNTFVKCIKKFFHALFYECGLGKSRAVIDIAREKYRQNGRVLRTVVLAPLAALINWKEEFIMYGGGRYKTEVLALSQKNKKKKLEAIAKHQGSIFIINHDSLNVKELYEFMFTYQIEFLIVDESQCFKNGTSKRTKALLKICRQKQLKFRFPLSGTPILNSLMDIWTQFRIMDENIFPKNFLEFRGAYMYDSNAEWAGKQGYFPDWKPLPDAFERLNKIIKRFSDRVLCDVLGLPPIITKLHHVYMTPEQEKHYKEMRDELVTYLDSGEACVANIALTKCLKLQQIVCGVFKDDKGKLHKLQTNRFKELKGLVEEIVGNGHKVIVWSCWAEGIYDEIIKVFEELNIGWTMITGEQKTGQEKQDAKDKFQNDPDCKAILCNQAAAGRAINLTAARYSVHLAKNYNREHDHQSRKRNHRGGSEIHDTIIQIDMETPNSIETIISDALRDKKMMSEAILDNKEYTTELLSKIRGEI